jgi:hypothetical protein
MTNKGRKMVSKKDIAEAIIQKVEEENDDVLIMTSMVKGYKRPEMIMSKEDQAAGYMPDVMLRTDDIIELYEIDLEQDFKLEKWMLFSHFTSSEKRTFSIVTPEDNVTPLKTFLNENDIEARILFFT